MALFDDPAWDVLSPERPLRFWRLIEINQAGAQPLMTSPLRADERIVNYLKGLNYIDDRLSHMLERLDARHEQPRLSKTQEKTSQAILQDLDPRRAGPVSLIQLVGNDDLSKQLVAVRVARDLGLSLFRLSAERLAQHDSELETLIRLWQRDSLLLPVALFLDAPETDDAQANDRAAGIVRSFLDRMPGIVLLSTRGTWTTRETNRIVIDVDRPTPGEQKAEWSRMLGETYETPALLAGQFSLNLPTIHEIANLSASPLPEDECDKSPAAARHPNHDSIWDACLSRTRPKFESLAQQIDAMATFDDLVLPQVQSDLLRAIVGQTRHRLTVYDEWGFRKLMNRGLGISALFAGESGTGKTMAAEVIADELRLNLYRIDLSVIVSKYIGETEKNLRRLFDAAEEGGAILFFDEADALFGKRSEVKDSHDRYANIEINYLLQRMESFAGLAILATNRKNALDKAFMRRLRFVVEFPFPNADDRREIWRRAFPRRMPKLDYNFLARLNLTGGSIHNIALNSAFLAAQQGLDEITMPLVLRAARTEMLKMERHINETDFHWEETQQEVAVA
jgi:predicted nucleic acid-binding protein